MDQVAKCFPYLLRNFEGEWPDNFGAPFIPLRIVSCNGLLSYCFSKAEVDVMAYPAFQTADGSAIDLKRKGVTDVHLYMGVMYDLLFNEDADKTWTLKALENLGFFFTRSVHLDCLKRITTEENKVPESAVQSVLAVHLFGPLMPDSEIRVDASRCGNNEAECRYCHARVKTDDTSFGNHKVWHGRCDIMLGHSVVKITTHSETESVDSATAYTDDLNKFADYVQEGEPQAKRAKSDLSDFANFACSSYDYLELGDSGGPEDDELQSTSANEVSSEDYMPDGPRHISFIDVIPNETLSKILSQTIVNAFLQVKRNNELQNYFIPSFLASSKYVTVHMYNPVEDVLLTQAEAMPLWLPSGALNRSSILSIWMALNMLQFSRCSPGLGDQTRFYEKSNFHDLVRHKLTKYVEEVTMPLGIHDSDYCKFSVLTAESHSHIIKEKERLEQEQLETS